MEIKINEKTFVLKKFSQARATIAMQDMDMIAMLSQAKKIKGLTEEEVTQNPEVIGSNLNLISKAIECVWKTFIKDEDKQVISKDDLYDCFTFEMTSQFLNEILASFEKKN